VSSSPSATLGALRRLIAHEMSHSSLYYRLPVREV